MPDNQLFHVNAEKTSGEFYSPVPLGYVLGKTKYVVITGSVISGIGKGTISSTLAKTLQDRGLRVVPMKLEAYLNVDSGTLNPFRHGEVFVLDDGSETDLDLGSYERMLDVNLTGDSFVTSGRIYKRIIEKERGGKFLGRDVQFIPHVTGEIKLAVRTLAAQTKADVVLIEIGGTVGDYENMFALEALRELGHEEGRENICFLNVTYILEPHALGEQKSKAAQLGIRRLMEMGIQPDIILCRSESPVHEGVREKLSLFANVPAQRVFSAHNVSNVYSLPAVFRSQGVDEEVCTVLGIAQRYSVREDSRMSEWIMRTSIPLHAEEVVIGIAGKYVGASDTYISVIKALEHCGFALGKKIRVQWIDTRLIEKETLSVSEAMRKVQGLIVPGGFGKEGAEGKIACIRYCREQGIPFLGLCFGFQLALVEFARNVCGLVSAHSTEIDPQTLNPVIDILPEQQTITEMGGSMRLGGHDVALTPGTKASRLHGTTTIRRRFRHRYECNPLYIEVFEQHGITFSGKAPDRDIMQLLELATHPFFMATQFHPELTSRPLRPDPLFMAFVQESLRHKL